MNTCPHCGLPALRFWKKMVVGPARDVYCPNCKNRIGVKVVPAYLSFVPALILVVWIPYMRHEDAMIAAGIGAFLVTIALYWWCVPLERRGLSLKREGAAVSPTSPQ